MKALETIQKYILYLTVGIYPLFILLSLSTPAVLPKAVLLTVSATLILIFWVIRMILKGSITFSSGKFDLGVLLFVLAYIAATIFATPNKMEALLIPGVTTFAILGGLFYFLINQLSKNEKRSLISVLFVSGLLYSLAIIFTQLNLFSKIPQLPLAIQDSTFNPLGGILPGLYYLIPLVLLGTGLILKEKENLKRIFWSVSVLVTVMAIVILIANALPGKSQAFAFPDFGTTWEVAIQTVAKAPIFGVGPGNYLSAFNIFRPVSYNASPLWQVRFSTASDFYLTLLTETGFVGLFALAVLLIAVYKYLRRGLDNLFDKIALGAVLVMFAVFPAASSIMLVFFVLLALNSESEPKTFKMTAVSVENLPSAVSSRIPAILVAILVLAAVGVSDFFGTKMIIAEVSFVKAINALTQNNAQDTFNFMQAAINGNPQVDRYHASMAQVEMALAQAIATKKNLTDTDRNTITQLVQQAINEGKNTVLLNSGRSGNWELLAQIYRSIMPFAQGADQFTVQTYTQAVALDPTNPNLRIALGGVYYALGRYQDAIDTFKLAVLAKNDLANAHYNLAIAYRDNKDADNAISEMNIVLSLVQPSSQDYTLAKNTLNDLQKNKATNATGSANLKAPQPVGTSNIKPPITLPNEATPPATTP